MFHSTPLRAYVTRLCVFLVVIALYCAPAVAQSLTLNGAEAPTTATAAAGTRVAITFADGPANTGDYVGLYPAGAADGGYLDMRYLNDSLSLPDEGLSDGAVTLQAPVTAGTYEVRFYGAGQSPALVVRPLIVSASPASLSVNGTPPPDGTTVAPGATLSVSVTGAPANPADMVLLYPSAETSVSGYLDLRFLNDTQVPPVAGLATATLHFTAPSTAGTYVFRLLTEASGFWGSGVVAASGTVTVAPTATLTVNGETAPSPASAAAGTRMSVEVTGGPANRGDWIGLFPAGAADNAYLDLRYLNNAVSLPEVGQADGVVVFQAPAIAGTYDIRFFAANTAPAITSSTVVVAAPTAVLTVNGSTAPADVDAIAGSQATVLVSGGPANRGDSVRLYAAGESNAGAYLDLRYLNDAVSLPETGATGGTLHFHLPTVPGAYEFRLVAELAGLTSPGILATSGSVTVMPSTTTLRVNSVAAPDTATATAGTRLTVAIGDGPANPDDFVALYPAGAADGGYLDFRYLNNQLSVPTAGLAEGP